MEDWKRILENVKFHCEFFLWGGNEFTTKAKVQLERVCARNVGRLSFTYLNEAMATLLCKWVIGTKIQKVQFEDVVSI